MVKLRDAELCQVKEISREVETRGKDRRMQIWMQTEAKHRDVRPWMQWGDSLLLLDGHVADSKQRNRIDTRTEASDDVHSGPQFLPPSSEDFN